MNDDKLKLVLTSVMVFIIWSLITFVFLFIIFVDKVEAATIKRAYIYNAANTQLYDSGAGSFNTITYTGNWNHIDLHYMPTGSNGQNILFSSTYTIRVNNPDVGSIGLNIWVASTTGSWIGIQDYCQNSGTRTDYDSYSTWKLTVVCNVPLTTNINNLIVRWSLKNSSGSNANYSYLNLIQNTNTIDTTGTSNSQIGNEIMNNDDKNTNIIVNNQNQNTQTINNSINGLNDSITSSSVDNPNNSLNSMSNLVPTNGVVSGLLLLPVQLFQAILNSIDGSCSSFSLGTLYNHNLTMPCINLQNKLGSVLYSAIDVIISGLFVLSIRKKFVDIFEHFTSLKTGGNELE